MNRFKHSKPPKESYVDEVRRLGADQDVARLAAKADLIIEELDIVVKQMAEMLRGAYGND